MYICGRGRFVFKIHQRRFEFGLSVLTAGQTRRLAPFLFLTVIHVTADVIDLGKWVGTTWPALGG